MGRLAGLLVLAFMAGTPARGETPVDFDARAEAAAAAAPGPHAQQLEQFGAVEAVPFSVAGITSVAGPPRVSRQVLGFLPYWVSSVQLRWDLMTQLLWFSVTARTDGTISNTHGWPDRDLISEAHRNGVKVTLVVTNFDSSSLGSLLGSATARTRLIDGLLDMVEDGGADGVNIDFEGVPASAKQNLSQFMTELSSRFHAAIPGSEVTLCTPAVDWSGAFDYDVLAENTDGLMIMGYGYHWSGSSNAGPGAPLRGGSRNLEWTVNDYLQWGGSQNRDKFILGLPWDGHDWATSSSEPHAPTTAKGTAVTYAVAKPKAAQYGRQWEALSASPWFRYTSGGQPHQAWYDDGESLEEKFELVHQNDLGGIGIWALGYDGSEPELWEAIERSFVPSSGTVAVR